VDRCNTLSRAGLSVRAYEWAGKSPDYIWDDNLVREFSSETVAPQPLFGLSPPLQATFRLLRHCLKDRATVYVIYSYQFAPFVVLALVLRVLNRSAISMNDSKFDDYPRNIFADLAKSALLKLYKGFLAASEDAAVYLRYLGCRNIQLYYCAVSVERIRVTGERAFADRPFIMIARYVKKKNHELVLAAYEAFLARTGSKRRLVLVGYGPLEQQLRERIAASPAISGSVEMRGYEDSSSIGELLANSLVLLLPSFEEQFGIVVTEALANGVPVIIGDRCGAIDLVDSGVNGFKVETHNADGLAWFMEAFERDEGLWRRMRAAAPAYAMKADTSRFVEALKIVAFGQIESPG
jgi:glycosyltransferase involved in cell wall biosynthesis